MEPDAFAAFLENSLESPSFFFILAMNCLLAFSVNLTNFLVTKCTSPLTLQVLGNAKGAVAVVVSIFLFRNPVSPVGMFGYSITIMGVVAYSRRRNGARRSCGGGRTSSCSRAATKGRAPSGTGRRDAGSECRVTTFGKGCVCVRSRMCVRYIQDSHPLAPFTRARSILRPARETRFFHFLPRSVPSPESPDGALARHSLDTR